MNKIEAGKIKKVLSYLLIAVISVIFICFLLQAGFARKADPESILKRSDFRNTSVTYSDTGGFRLEGSDVYVRISGDGTATLQNGDKATVTKTISRERYRELLESLAHNRFKDIGVKRRWFHIVWDVPKYTITLQDGFKKTTVYCDEKHYVSDIDSFNRIMDTILSFQTEFGQEFLGGTCASAGTPDYMDYLLTLFIAVTGIGAIISAFVKLRKTSREHRNNVEGSQGDSYER